MNQAADNGWWYFAQIKSNHGEVVEYRAWTYDLTKRAIVILQLWIRGARRVQMQGAMRERSLSCVTEEQRRRCGRPARETLLQNRDRPFSHGWLDWKHARQIVRVQRVATSPTTGKRRVGNRYYVTNCPLDAEMRDDRGRLAWSRHPDGILTVGVLRLIALSILAVVRRMSRIGYTQETPSWGEVMEHFLLQLCAPILNTCAFDEV